MRAAEPRLTCMYHCCGLCCNRRPCLGSVYGDSYAALAFERQQSAQALPKEVVRAGCTATVKTNIKHGDTRKVVVPCLCVHVRTVTSRPVLTNRKVSPSRLLARAHSKSFPQRREQRLESFSRQKTICSATAHMPARSHLGSNDRRPCLLPRGVAPPPAWLRTSGLPAALPCLDSLPPPPGSRPPTLLRGTTGFGESAIAEDKEGNRDGAR